MVDIKDSRKIVYVFDASCAREDYGIVKEHVINYLNAFEVSVDSGELLYSDDEKGLDYYQAVFSYPCGKIVLRRSSENDWILKIPNKGEIFVRDDGNINILGELEKKKDIPLEERSESYVPAVITVVYIRATFAKNRGSFECINGHHDVCYNVVDSKKTYGTSYIKDSSTKLSIYTDKFGNIKITLFYEGPKGSIAKEHFILIGGHKYSVQEYITMLNDGIRDEKIPLEEQKLISAMFNDPRISSMLENFLAKIPTSLDEWYRLQSLAIDNDYAAAKINEQNRFAEEQIRLQEEHDEKVAKINADCDKQVDRLNAEVMKLASKLAGDSSDDKGGPVFVKSDRRGKNNI